MMGLREKVIERLKAHPESLDMRIWAIRSECGTVACLAGHIQLAAGENPVDEDGEAEYNVDTVARDLWAKEYGNEAAEELPFFEMDWNWIFQDWGDERFDEHEEADLSKVTAADVIRWLTENAT
jgi:hypothetical protein